MIKDEVMLELSIFGNDQTKKVFTRHGAREELEGQVYHEWFCNSSWQLC